MGKEFKCNKENTKEETIILSRNDKVNLDSKQGYEILQFEGNWKLNKCNKKQAEVIGEETDVKVKNDLYFACYSKEKEECTGKLIVKMKSSSPSLSPIPSSLPIAVTSRSQSSVPSSILSGNPSMIESNKPSIVHSFLSNSPTLLLSGEPTHIPSNSPTHVSSQDPSLRTTSFPSDSPSYTSSSVGPTNFQSDSPSYISSLKLSSFPSDFPTRVTSQHPSTAAIATSAFSSVPSTYPTASKVI